MGKQLLCILQEQKKLHKSLPICVVKTKYFTLTFEFKKKALLNIAILPIYKDVNLFILSNCVFSTLNIICLIYHLFLF